jgi:amino-acid N-acetyltransferase
MTTLATDASVTIRPATDADRPAIEALLTASHLPIEGVSNTLCSFLVAVSNENLVATVGLEHCGKYGLLRSTAVAPEWRSRGIARRLVERIVAEAEQRGLNALYLLTTTAETYFPSFGFQVTTRVTVPDEIRATREFQGACPESATVMCLSLDR